MKNHGRFIYFFLVLQFSNCKHKNEEIKIQIKCFILFFLFIHTSSFFSPHPISTRPIYRATLVLPNFATRLRITAPASSSDSFTSSSSSNWFTRNPKDRRSLNSPDSFTFVFVR